MTSQAPLTPTLIQRLAFAKYLLAIGCEQARRPEPLAAAGLLALHDAVEFSNAVASEFLSAKLPSQVGFLDYWTALSPKLSPHDLPERNGMARLNKARVALKHYGTMPSRLDIDSFIETTQRFFALAFPLVFGLDIESVSMIEFIASPKARKHLQLAQEHLRAGTLEPGFSESAMAFIELLYVFEENTKDDMGRPLIGATPRFSSAHRVRREVGGSSSEGPSELSRFVDDVTRTLDDLGESVKLVAFGIDLRRLARFRRLTPHVARMMDGSMASTWGRQPTLDAGDLEFCIQFVLASALKVQEY